MIHNAHSGVNTRHLQSIRFWETQINPIKITYQVLLNPSITTYVKQETEMGKWVSRGVGRAKYLNFLNHILTSEK